MPCPLSCTFKPIKDLISHSFWAYKTHPKASWAMWLGAMLFLPVCKYCSVLLLGWQMIFAHQKYKAAHPEAMASCAVSESTAAGGEQPPAE
jgi:hypothetical protein